MHLLGTLDSSAVVDTVLLDRVKLALPEASLVAEKRNRLIHDQWLFEEEKIPSGEIRLLSVKIGVGSEGRTVDLASTGFHITELYNFLDTVGKQQNAFQAFLESLPTGN